MVRNTNKNSYASSGWIDVTVPIRVGMVTWPGNATLQIERRHTIVQGDNANSSNIHMGAHTGTHMDAPLHFLDNRISIPARCSWNIMRDRGSGRALLDYVDEGIFSLTHHDKINMMELYESFLRKGCGMATAENDNGLPVADVVRPVARPPDPGLDVPHATEPVALDMAARYPDRLEEVRAELSLFGMECKGLEFSMYITKESLAQQL